MIKIIFKVCFFLLLWVLPVVAQQPSRTQTQPAVLQALGQQVGVPNMTLGSLVNWSWSFGTYDFVLGQGCVGAPAAAPAAGGWQRYVLNYRGTEYVYLISDDIQFIFLCNEAALSTVVPITTPIPATALPLGAATTTPTPNITHTPAPTTNPCLLPPRLSVGGTAQVTPGEPNWVHAEASRQSTKTGEIPAEAVVQVLEGPRCDAAARMIYWRVQYGNLTGWTSEGLDEYWLEPILSARTGFTVDSAPRAISAEWLQAYPAGIQALIFAPNGDTMAVLDPNGAVMLYNTTDLSFMGQLTRTEPVQRMAMSHDGVYMATVVSSGTVYTWETATQRALGQAVHSGDVTALAFSPVADENRILAAADTTGIIWLWAAPVVTPTSLPLIKLTVTGIVAALEFSPDAAILVAKNSDGVILGVWQIQ